MYSRLSLTLAPHPISFLCFVPCISLPCKPRGIQAFCMTAFRHRSPASASELIGDSLRNSLGTTIMVRSLPSSYQILHKLAHMVLQRADSFSFMMYSLSIERIKEPLLDIKSNIKSHQKELWRCRLLPVPGPIPYVSK